MDSTAHGPLHFFDDNYMCVLVCKSLNLLYFYFNQKYIVEKLTNTINNRQFFDESLVVYQIDS